MSRTSFTGLRAALVVCVMRLWPRPRWARQSARARVAPRSGPVAAAGASCPGVVNASGFTSQAQLRKMTAKFNSYGPRILGSHGPQQGDRVAGEAGPRDRAQHPLPILQALRLVPTHRFQARTGARHRRGGRAQRHPLRWVQGECPRRRGGSLVQADREERRGRPARLPREGKGDHRRERGGQGGHSRLPDRFAAFRRSGSAARPLPDARPRRLHGVHPAVPGHAPRGADRGGPGRGRGSHLHLRRAQQAGARLLRPARRDSLPGSSGLHRQR